MNQLLKTRILQKIVCHALAFSLLLGMCIGHAPAASAASEDPITVDSLLQNWRSGEGDYPSKPVEVDIPGLTDGPTIFYWWGIVHQSYVSMMPASGPPLTSTKSDTGGYYYMPSNMPGVIKQPYPTYGLFCIQLQCADEARNEFFRWLLFETIDQAARYAEDGDTIVVNGDYNDFTLNGLENVVGGHQTKHGTFTFTYDISPNFKIPAGKNITIDLRGHEITFSPNAGRPGKVEQGLDAITDAYGIGPLQDGARTGIVVGQGASLTIIDSSDEQTGKIVGMARATYPDEGNTNVNENEQDYCVIENNGTVIIAEGIEINNLAADTTGAAEGTAYDVFVPESAADATIILPESMKGHITTNVAEIVGAVVGYALPADASVTVGRTTTLTVSPAHLPAGAAVEWVSDNTAVATVSDGVVTGVSAGTANITATIKQGNTTITATNTCSVTVTKASGGSGGGGSSSSSSSSNTTTQTTTNPDGSKTTTVTDKKTGTVTETTKNKDGSTLVVETKKDGTVTTTETAANGVKVKTVDAPREDVTATVTIPRSVDAATVTVPANTSPGTVAVDAKTGEIVKLSVPTKDGMLVKLDGSADLILEDRSKYFEDVHPVNHWAKDTIDFATAHEMFGGTSETTFTPNAPMTRAMLMTVLARFDGEDTTGGSVWHEKGMEWAKQNGVSDGSNPNGSITREQFATMLWRYAGSPAVAGDIDDFSDGGKVSGYADQAMRWAVSTGIIGGMGDGTLNPQGNATRAQVATMLMRFVENLTK